ncbi:MAG: serine/threonine-protein kinase [Candidatus Algichlamydia australiensis]|nr:serine/threonine-protein kinase [Chlamydiales bacterium]
MRAKRTLANTLANTIYGRKSPYPNTLASRLLTDFTNCKLGKTIIGEGSYSKVLVMEHFNPETQTREHKALKLVKPEINPTSKKNVKLFGLTRKRPGGEWNALDKFGPHVLSASHAIALNNKTRDVFLFSAEKFQEYQKISQEERENLHYTLIGTVSEYIQGSKTLDKFGIISTEKVRIYGTQLLKGLKDIHSHSIIHRDMKPENVIVTQDGKEVKIIDLGFSRVADKERKRQSIKGSPIFAAPELLFNEGYNYKVDIYSLGITFLFMATGLDTLLDENGNNIDTLDCLRNFLSDPKEKAKNNLLKLVQDSNLRDLIKVLTQKEPENRPTAEEALNHPFFQVNA